MAAAGKTVLFAIVGAIGVMLLIQMATFFPWYVSIISETYQLSAEASSYNFVHQESYDETLARMRERPVFKRRPDKIKIKVESGASGNPVFDGEAADAYGAAQVPYVQRGEPITVTVSAAYPLEIRLWGDFFDSGVSRGAVNYDSRGVTIKVDVPVSFSITTIGVHYYKDLDIDQWYVS